MPPQSSRYCALESARHARAGCEGKVTGLGASLLAAAKEEQRLRDELQWRPRESDDNAELRYECTHLRSTADDATSQMDKTNMRCAAVVKRLKSSSTRSTQHCRQNQQRLAHLDRAIARDSGLADYIKDKEIHGLDNKISALVGHAQACDELEQSVNREVHQLYKNAEIRCEITGFCVYSTSDELIYLGLAIEKLSADVSCTSKSREAEFVAHVQTKEQLSLVRGTVRSLSADKAAYEVKIEELEDDDATREEELVETRTFYDLKRAQELAQFYREMALLMGDLPHQTDRSAVADVIRRGQPKPRQKRSKADDVDVWMIKRRCVRVLESGNVALLRQFLAVEGLEMEDDADSHSATSADITARGAVQ
ncbi:hypothetical protein LTR65_002588 [Meristemomyces frigidus]